MGTICINNEQLDVIDDAVQWADKQPFLPNNWRRLLLNNFAHVMHQVPHEVDDILMILEDYDLVLAVNGAVFEGSRHVLHEWKISIIGGDEDDAQTASDIEDDDAMPPLVPQNNDDVQIVEAPINNNYNIN